MIFSLKLVEKYAKQADLSKRIFCRISKFLFEKKRKNKYFKKFITFERNVLET